MGTRVTGHFTGMAGLALTDNVAPQILNCLYKKEKKHMLQKVN